MTEPTDEEIRIRAHQLWEQAGNPKVVKKSSGMRPNKNCGTPTNPRHFALPTTFNQRMGRHWREATHARGMRIC